MEAGSGCNSKWSGAHMMYTLFLCVFHGDKAKFGEGEVAGKQKGLWRGKEWGLLWIGDYLRDS